MVAKFRSNRSFSDVNDSAGDREKFKLQDHFKVLKLTADYTPGRLIGPTLGYARHWIKIRTKDNKEVGVPFTCLAYDSENDTLDSTKECPFCDSGDKPKIRYLTNFLVRDLQDNMPAKLPAETREEQSTGFKDIKSKSWTPVVVLDLPAGAANKVKKKSMRNKATNPKTKESKVFPLSHEKFGADIEISFDANAKSASESYDVELLERTPLSAEEQDFLVWNIDLVTDKLDGIKLSVADAKKELKKLSGGGDSDDADDNGYNDDLDDSPRSRGGATKARGASNGKSQGKAQGRRQQADDDLDLDDGDEEEAPPARGRGGKSSRSAPADDFDDAGDDFDDVGDDFDDDGADEAPPARGRGGKAQASKKPAGRRAAEPEDDDDEFGGFDDVEDEAPPARGRGGKASGGKSSRAPAAKASGKRGSRQPEPEDDDGGDDFGDDDDFNFDD